MKTKDKILKCALKLFANQGIDKTSTAQITKEIGIASGTLFVHFKTKQELIDTLYVNIKRKAFSGFDQILDLNFTVKQNFEAIAKKLIEYFANNYDEFIFLELVDMDPQVSAEAITKGYENFQIIVELFNKWAIEGHFKEIDVNLILQINWGIAKVLIKSLKANRQKTVSDTQLDLLWDSIRQSSSTY